MYGESRIYCPPMAFKVATTSTSAKPRRSSLTQLMHVQPIDAIYIPAGSGTPQFPQKAGLPAPVQRRPERRLRLVEAIRQTAEACADAYSRSSDRRVHARTPCIAPWYGRNSRPPPIFLACNIGHYERRERVARRLPARRLPPELLQDASESSLMLIGRAF